MSATIKEQSDWLSESAANHRDWAEWGVKNPDDPRLKINGDPEHHALWADREQAYADRLRQLNAECERWKEQYLQSMEQHGFKREDVL